MDKKNGEVLLSAVEVLEMRKNIKSYPEGKFR